MRSELGLYRDMGFLWLRMGTLLLELTVRFQQGKTQLLSRASF